jgi:hypothetical protein
MLTMNEHVFPLSLLVVDNDNENCARCRNLGHFWPVSYIKIRLKCLIAECANRKLENPAKLHCKKFAKSFSCKKSAK